MKRSMRLFQSNDATNAIVAGAITAPVWTVWVEYVNLLLATVLSALGIALAILKIQKQRHAHLVIVDATEKDSVKEIAQKIKDELGHEPKPDR